MFSSLCLMLILLMSVDGKSSSNNRPSLPISQSEVLDEELFGSNTIYRRRRDNSDAHPYCRDRVGNSVCDNTCSTAGVCADDDVWVPVANCSAIANTICLDGQCVPGSVEDCQPSKERTDHKHVWRPDGRSWTSAHMTDTKLPIFSGAHPNCSGLTGTFVCEDTCRAYGVCTRKATWVPITNCAAIPNRICRDGQCVPGRATDCGTNVISEGMAVENIQMKPNAFPRNCTGLIGMYVCDDNCTTKGVCATEDSWVPVIICNAYPDTICLDGQCVVGDDGDCPAPNLVKSAGSSVGWTPSDGGTGFNGTHPDCSNHIFEYLCSPDCKATGVCVGGEPAWVDTEYCAIIPHVMCLNGTCTPGIAENCPLPDTE